MPRATSFWRVFFCFCSFKLCFVNCLFFFLSFFPQLVQGFHILHCHRQVHGFLGHASDMKTGICVFRNCVIPSHTLDMFHIVIFHTLSWLYSNIYDIKIKSIICTKCSWLLQWHNHGTCICVFRNCVVSLKCFIYLYFIFCIASL